MDSADGPLDFETEDLLLAPAVPVKTRKKVIGLDDLLTDYYKDKSKNIERDAKRKKARKVYHSDEDDVQADEANFSKHVDQCQQMIGEISGDDDLSFWGIQVFRAQQPFPSVDTPELGSCKPLQSFLNNELNSLVGLSPQNVESFLKGLLVNGWLLKLVVTYGHIEKSIAAWAVNLMFYSQEEDIRISACNFWLAVLSSENRIDAPFPDIHWLPSCAEIKRALVLYGFSMDFPTKSTDDGSDCCGPPQNIRGWIKFVGACCRLRIRHSIFSTSEAEELVGIIICLFLDRQLQGLVVLLHECLLSVIGYFTEEEWNDSCNNIAKSLGCRVPRDVNCLHILECITGVNARSKDLRSAVAYQILVACFDNKVTEAEEILRLLMSVNLKEKSCDLFRVYIYLVLTENWLLYNGENKSLISEQWGVYLRNCYFQISGADLRSHASKVRTKAAYLLQGVVSRR